MSRSNHSQVVSNYLWQLYSETKLVAHRSRPAHHSLGPVRAVKCGVDLSGGKSRSVALQSTSLGGKLIGNAPGDGPTRCANMDPLHSRSSPARLIGFSL